MNSTAHTNSRSERKNVAARLRIAARATPDAVAIAFPRGYDAQGKRQYDEVTFAQLDCDVERLARGIVTLGARPGTRIALLVRPSIDFIALVFALLRSGAVTILIDPGMGRKNLVRCLSDAEPEGFIAISPVHAVRTLLGGKFPKARINVTLGRRWFWGGLTLNGLRELGVASDVPLPKTEADDPAAIIFTTGSTGPPKGVLYSHGNFDTQVTEIQGQYGIQPGEVDLPGFPLFGLFNAAMGVTTVIPDMDPTRPARVDPLKIIEAVSDYQVTQAFGSPAIWNRVGRYCQEQNITLPSLRRVLSAGAPVPAHVLRRMTECIAADGEIFTPYGATEALPVASIAAGEVLGETWQATDGGAGVCVGRRFSQIDWQVIRITDGPIASIDDALRLPTGEIGELIVRGPQITQEYATRVEWNARSKIADGRGVWHRMGDAGYLDEQQRFWFCGRVAHRLLTAAGPMYTVPCEAIFNRHDAIYRSALVGVGSPGKQEPVIIAEPLPDRMPNRSAARQKLIDELQTLASENPLTAPIKHVLLHRSLPVDIRHNAKIFRERLTPWAQKHLRNQ